LKKARYKFWTIPYGVSIQLCLLLLRTKEQYPCRFIYMYTYVFLYTYVCIYIYVYIIIYVHTYRVPPARTVVIDLVSSQEVEGSEVEMGDGIQNDCKLKTLVIANMHICMCIYMRGWIHIIVYIYIYTFMKKRIWRHINVSNTRHISPSQGGDLIWHIYRVKISCYPNPMPFLYFRAYEVAIFCVFINIHPYLHL
jgi:hypothetical protein